MESRVHDVEEHFRRSLQQIQREPSSQSSLEAETHKIIVSENSPQQIRATPSPVQTTPTLSPTGMLIRQHTSDSSDRTQRVASSSNILSPHGAPPPLILGVPGGTKPDSIKSYNEGMNNN